MTPGKIARGWFSRILQRWKSKPLAWMDTETTGFNPRKQEILSLSMLDEKGRPLLRHPRTQEPLHEVRIKPKNLEEASEEALKINRYSEEAWADAIPFEEIADQIAEVVKTHRLAGHNVAFDRDFIEADLKKAGHDVKADPEVVDTMALSFLAGIPSNKLGITTDVLGIPLGGAAHGAYPDTEASRKVWLELRDPKKVEQTRARMREEYGGPARGVAFTALETRKTPEGRKEISRLAVVDHHGRPVYDASFGTGPGEIRPEDAVKDVASVYDGNMFGGDNPSRDANMVRSFIRQHSPKKEDGKPELGFYSPVLDTATLRHVYGVGNQAPEGADLMDKARASAGTFHEVADRAFGPRRPHRSPQSDFETWAQGRTFNHPLSKDDPRRRKDFITYSTLVSMAEKGLGGGETDVMEKAQKRLDSLRRTFDAWQRRVQQHQVQ